MTAMILPGSSSAGIRALQPAVRTHDLRQSVLTTHQPSVAYVRYCIILALSPQVHLRWHARSLRAGCDQLLDTAQMMVNSDSARPNLAVLLVRLPEKADQIRELVATNEEFYELCEHYSLARAALERFLRRATKRQRPEVAEYKDVIADLEREIQDFIERQPQFTNQL